MNVLYKVAFNTINFKFNSNLDGFVFILKIFVYSSKHKKKYVYKYHLILFIKYLSLSITTLQKDNFFENILLTFRTE